MKNISRRDFLKGSAATVAGAAALGLLGACTTSEQGAASGTDTEKYDKECDFLIVGYGLAGEAAALEANDIDPNAKICILEKMEEAQAGGNSIASGQTVIVPAPDDLETFKKYLIACSQPNPIPDEYIDFMANEFSDQRGWIQGTVAKVGYELGYVAGGPVAWGKLVTEFPELDGANFKGCSAHVRKAGEVFEYGGVWRGFDLAVRDRGENIELMFSTAFTSLIQNPDTKEAKGVVAVGADGKEIRIKANKGVLLACGGYENNLQMQRDFHGMDMVYTGGTPGNTGDGIHALMNTGAKIWHMKNQTQSGGFWLGIKVPEHEATFMRNFSMPANSWIEVCADDKRFYNESYAYHRQHMKYKEFGHFVDLPHDRALPVDLIFDEKTRTAGAIVTKWLSWPITTEGYVWSDDNSEEIAKGWIIKADTIEELAGKLGRDPQVLKATIDTYNAGCQSGKDEFGRSAETLAPIDTAPFYAVGITPTLVATTGGAERNVKAQVLDWNDNPIPNLYEAGELGSYVSNLYQNGMFLAEAIATGRAAADTAFNGRSAVTAEVSGIVEEKIDITKKPDGTYDQKINGNHGAYTLRATVEGGKVTNLEIVSGRENMFMEDDQLQAFFDEVINGQNVEVDAISGATLDSNNLRDALKAIFK